MMLVMVDKPKTRDVEPLPPHVQRYAGTMFDRTLMLPEGTLGSVMGGDDWSFVIRSHALIEGLVSQLLAHTLDPRLVPVFEMLELGKEGIGKLAFAKALELLSSDDRRFISLMSLLRNRLAHNPKYLSFTFKEYVAKLDKQQRDNMFAAVASGVSEDAKQRWLELLREDPRHAITARTFVLLIHLLAQTYRDELKSQHVPDDILDAFRSDTDVK